MGAVQPPPLAVHEAKGRDAIDAAPFPRATRDVRARKQQRTRATQKKLAAPRGGPARVGAVQPPPRAGREAKGRDAIDAAPFPLATRDVRGRKEQRTRATRKKLAAPRGAAIAC